MSGFPKLVPALTVQITLGEPIRVGMVSAGAPLTIVPVTAGHLKSVEGSPMMIDAKFVHGMDTSRADPTHKHVRLDVNCVFENVDGALIALTYQALMPITPLLMAIMMKGEGAKTTDFGSFFAQMRFETGAEALKELEGNQYVGSGRFVVEEGKPLVAEYNISKIVA